MGYEARELTQEEKNKIESVKRLLQMSDKPIDKVKLADVERFERQAGMDFEERVLDLARDNTPYKSSRMQQRFSAIRKIAAVRGSILIEVDEQDSEEAAKLQAFRVLGPLASPEEVCKYVAEHTSRTTLLSIPRFVKNLRLILSMAKTAPEYFGEGTGGGTLKDIIEASKSAIREAREYLRRFKDAMPPGVYNMLRGGNVQLKNTAEFVTYLGEGWETELHKAGSITSAHNLLVTKNFKK